MDGCVRLPTPVPCVLRVLHAGVVVSIAPPNGTSWKVGEWQTIKARITRDSYRGHTRNGPLTPGDAWSWKYMWRLAFWTSAPKRSSGETIAVRNVKLVKVLGTVGSVEHSHNAMSSTGTETYTVKYAQGGGRVPPQWCTGPGLAKRP